MEYRYVDKAWQSCLADGNIDQALKAIEYQIAMNLLIVHNTFCTEQLKAPIDVYNELSYGCSSNAESVKKMEPFVEFSERLQKVSYKLDDDYEGAKEEALEDYKNIENDLKCAVENL